MAAPDAGPARMIATLAVAGLCAGLAIVGIFLVTRPVIERNRAEALEAAIFEVLEDATRRETLVLRDGELVPQPPAQNGAPTGDGAVVYAGYDQDGKLIGYAIPAEGPGFQDTIKLLYGFDPGRGRIVGMEVLESRETPGLGDKIMKDPEFLASFQDLAVDPEIELAKKGRTQENEVDAISGATISSSAVVRIINDANDRWLSRLKDGRPAETAAGSEPAQAAGTEAEGAAESRGNQQAGEQTARAAGGGAR